MHVAVADSEVPRGPEVLGLVEHCRNGNGRFPEFKVLHLRESEAGLRDALGHVGAGIPVDWELGA
jgi:hypothetical protein